MNTPPTWSGTAALTHWGVIRARGADAASFLQGQLTNDVATFSANEWRLAGFCSAKGRLQASFLVWKAAPDELLLACSAGLLTPTLKRLSMFVMRAQCKLSDASAELALLGVAGDAAQCALVDQPVGSVQRTASGAVLRLPDAGALPRGVLVMPQAEAPASAMPLDLWRWLELQSGVPTIEAATVDRFVPQMLNYELIGGVDFKKGCYPGQEVVARSQYRGTIKRRMFLFDSDGEAGAGQDVFHSDDPGQPAGLVVNAAPRPEGGGTSALIEVKLAALEAGSLHLGSVDGPVLRQAELPYVVPMDSATTT